MLRVACTRPDLIRSWASDVAGLLDPSYVWRLRANLADAGAGEEWVAGNLATPREDRIALLQAFGVTPGAAAAFTGAFDEEMGRCILALYRSAAQPALAEWANDAEAAAVRPGSSSCRPRIRSPVGPSRRAGGCADGRPRGGARRARALVVAQDPARGARVLESFWDSISA